MEDKVGVIIVAAGNGSRMGDPMNKLFLEVDGKPILAHTLSRFYDMDLADEIVVALNPNDYEYFEGKVIGPYGFENIKVVEGGADRQESAYNALKALSPDTDYVLIHDGARPFTSEAIINDCLIKTKEFGAAAAALPAGDTIKVSADGHLIDHTPQRSTLYEAQTPQGFKYDLICEANHRREKENFPATDDASIAEHAGYPVALSRGEKSNIKITTPDDLLYAEILAQIFYPQ